MLLLNAFRLENIAVLNAEFEPQLKANHSGSVGIDIGIREFYTDSEGNTVSNPKYLGFDQTVYGFKLYIQDIGRLEHITKEIYPDIAKQFHPFPKYVERNIRTMVNTICLSPKFLWMYLTCEANTCGIVI